MSPTSSSEDIHLSKLSPFHHSNSIADEERDALLFYGEDDTPSARKPSRIIGAIWQITAFVAVGLVIVLAGGVFTYSIYKARSEQEDIIHAPLPGLKNPLLLKYFGGMGPYIGGEYVDPPEVCQVSQVHMISRHGERYPTIGMGALIARFAENISRLPSDNFNSHLSFLNGWNLDTDNWLYSPEYQLEQETLTGPAAGSQRMFTLGSEFRARYRDLWGFRQHGPVKVWSSDSRRVIHSATYFSTAFFGVDVDVSVEVVPETMEQWGNSLTTT